MIKKLNFILILWMVCETVVFSQVTRLTINCQNPGSLSSMISYTDQLSLQDIKISGYINGTDIQFIRDLNKNSLKIIDLEDVYLVAGGVISDLQVYNTIYRDNYLSWDVFNGMKKIQKIVLPRLLIPSLSANYGIQDADSVIWTNNDVKEICIENISNPNGGYLYLPEGIESIYNSNMSDKKIVLPSTIKKITGHMQNVTFYSYITNPQNVSSVYEYFYSTGFGGYYSYWSNTYKCKFYIPKGTKEEYMNSDFATRQVIFFGSNGRQDYYDNDNTFIEYYDVDSIEIVADSLKIFENDEYNMNVKILPGTDFVSDTLFAVSNPDIVCLPRNGIVKGVHYGETDVIVTPKLFIKGLNTVSKKCHVTVMTHPKGIDMVKNQTVKVGETFALNAKTLPLNYTVNEISYLSKDNSVATVTKDGIVKGVSSGECKVIAKTIDGGIYAECLVSVLHPITSLAISNKISSIKLGNSYQLVATFSPVDADDTTIKWSTSNSEIIKIDQTGKLTAISLGQAIITAESVSGVKATCEITVVPILMSSIALDRTNVELRVGECAILTSEIFPINTTNKTVSWKSDNPTVATISNDGIISAISAGIAVITASSTDGSNISASCIVNVSNILATLVNFDKKSLSMKVDENVFITANVYPDNTTNKVLAWKSSFANVATVDANGNVFAKGEGSTTITATTTDGTNLSDTCQVVVTKKKQTIIWQQSLDDIAYGGQLVELTATSSSGLPVAFSSSNEDVASIFDLGNIVYLNAVNPGIAQVTATQSGNDYYEAVSMTREINVNEPDGVRDVQLDSDKFIIYTAGGVRVGIFSHDEYENFMRQKKQKGVYVVNGKKTVVR